MAASAAHPPTRLRSSVAGLFLLAVLGMLLVMPQDARAGTDPDFALGAGAPRDARRLSELGTHFRKLIVFAPEGPTLGIAGMKWRAMRQLLADPAFSAGLAERDVVVVLVSREAEPIPGPVLTARVAASETSAARRVCGLGDGPGALVLVGKDGGCKQTWTSAPAAAEVFALIDSMPMRQAELKEKK